MPATFTVRNVLQSDDYDFPGDDGTQVFLTAYEVQVDGEQSNGFDPATNTLWINRKRGGDPPSAGEELFVDVRKTKRGWTGKAAAKRDRDRTPFDGSSKAGYRQQDPPEIQAAIRRSHAQEMALRLVLATGDSATMDLSNKETVGTYLNTVVRPLVDWFQRDVDQASQQADDAS